MKLTEDQIKLAQVIEEIRTASELNGTSELTLDEINEEIRLARLERKKQ